MKIVFRTDASLTIGTGHVMRCLALARALAVREHTCHFICRNLPGNLARLVGKEFSLTLLPAPSGAAPCAPPNHAAWAEVEWAKDAEETRAAVDEADWLILDHYAFDARWERNACPTGARIMVIDDLADRPHECDLLLDQNLGREATDYDGLVSAVCTRLIGPHYALLRSEFRDARKASLSRREAESQIHHILVSMGGMDMNDATSRVLRALALSDLPSEVRITVVMGSNALALERVRELAAQMPLETEVLVDVRDMARLMSEADLAIGAAGSTTWERCTVGLPSIVIELADNQAGIAQTMTQAGAALDPGDVRAADFACRLGATLNEAKDRLSSMAKMASAICDGEGIERVLLHLTEVERNGRPIS